MKKIVFSKHSNERDRRFAIRTDIWEENGARTVEKTACYPEGESHVAQIAGWYEKLEGQFGHLGLHVNRVVRAEGGSVCLEYLAGGYTLEKHLYELIRQEQEEKAFRILEKYLEILRTCAVFEFETTPEFCRVFGEVCFSEKQKCMAVTDIDMVLENVVLTGEEKVWNLIDYEWTFDFPIPVNFVIYRVWHYFLSRNLPDRVEELFEYCQREGMTAEQIRIYDGMEKAFQLYAAGNHVPLREMYAGITPGCTPLSQLGFGERKQRQGAFKSTLSLRNEDGRTEWAAVSQIFLKEDHTFEAVFDLSKERENLKGQRKLFWNPMEGQLCRIELEKIAAAVPVKASAVNGFKEDGAEVFWTRDPVYQLTGAFQKVERMVIRGRFTSLTLEKLLPEFVETRIQRDAYFAELENVRGRLAAIRATKGFRVLEGARRVRNYLVVRVKSWTAKTKQRLGQNKYHGWYARHRASEEELERQRKNVFSYCPRISILVPTYKTPEKFLKAMLDSVLAQTYKNWELCIADGGSGKEVTDILDRYAAADQRIKYTVLKENAGISENTNSAARMASGDYIALLDHDDLLAPEALFEVVQALQTKEAPEVLYSDEDKVNMAGTEYFSPHFKPDFSPDLLRSHNYITHLFVVKRQLFESAGGFRREFDGAQDYDLILRCAEAAKEVCHIPKILYHWRMHKNSTAENPESKTYAYEAGKKALEEHLKRCGIPAKVENTGMYGMYHVVYDTPGDPLVSVIIPNMDHREDLDKCIRSVLGGSYRNLEIVVVENNSRETETLEYYQKIREEFPQVRVEVWEKEFNYSAINNFGVKKARGEYLLLLNNDTEMIAPDSVSQMLGCCMQSGVGAVGAKLLFGDDTVQHAGIILGFGGFAGHVFSGFKKEEPGYMSRAVIIGNFSAVTAACLMVKREVYQQMGGFSEEFAVALNDVDFCMKLRSADYRIIMNPFALWHHYESKSRGYEDTPEKQVRFQKEVALFRDYWGETVDAGDPYYNPAFSVKEGPFTLA